MQCMYFVSLVFNPTHRVANKLVSLSISLSRYNVGSTHRGLSRRAAGRPGRPARRAGGPTRRRGGVMPTVQIKGCLFHFTQVSDMSGHCA